MARSNNGSTSNYFSVATTMYKTAPFSVSAWVNLTTTASYSNLVCSALGSGSNAGYVALYMHQPTASLAFGVSDGGGDSTFRTATNSFTINTWHHCVGTWNNGNTARPYLDGAVGATDIGAGNIGGTPSVDTLFLGVNRNGGVINTPIFGALAEVTIWNIILTQNEISALAKGVNARLVRSGAIQGYWPLWGLTAPEPDMSPSATRHNLTMTGTMSASNHAPVTLWTRRRTMSPVIGAAVPDTLFAQACL